MNNSVSEQSFYIQSDDEDDDKVSSSDEGGNDSDASGSSAENGQQIQSGSYNTIWPQSYRYTLYMIYIPYLCSLFALFHFQKIAGGNAVSSLCIFPVSFP